MGHRCIPELSAIGVNFGLDVIGSSVIVCRVLDASQVVAVLLWKNFTVLNWLYSGVMMVLVDLTVDSGGY